MNDQNTTSTNEQSPEIHLIGNAHIDPVWLWPWTDGFSEVKATFQAAMDRIETYPDFIFTCAGACYYQWVEQNCPALFEKIKKAVQEGRWVPVGGWYVQPDCNIPCGESFARHGLYSQRYYLEKFGLLCDTGYNVDSFGHNGMLPQILQQSGMKYYVFHRPSDQEKPGVDHIFYWQSPDGSRVLAYKIPLGYGASNPARLASQIDQVAQIGKKLHLDMMFFYGVGNHGGGPTIALLNEIEKLRRQPGFYHIKYSSPPAFMKSIEEKNPDLQVLADDLQHHAIGCYSAMLKVKQQNRRAEQRLLAGERFQTLAHCLFGGKAETTTLKKAWEKVLFNQFHDVLAGCSIRKAYEDASDFYGYALCVASEVMNDALQRISWAIDTQGTDSIPRSKEEDWKLWGQEAKGTPMMVFNPLPFSITAPVEACGDLHAVMKPLSETPDSFTDSPNIIAITDSDGVLLPIQQVRGPLTNHKKGKWNTLFLASLPPLGYATFWLHKRPVSENQSKNAEALTHQPVSVFSDGTGMENDFVSITFSETENGIVQLYDKRLGHQLLSGPAAVGLVIDETESDTWGHNLKEYRDVIGKFKEGRLKVLESGPLRGCIRLTTFWNHSYLEQDFYLLYDRPDIEVKVRIFWQERHRMLKIEFPFNIEKARSVQEIPYGFMERPMDGEEKPIQQWVDVGNDQCGVSILNDSSYAVDVLDGTVRLTILRGAAYADHYGERDDRCEYMDQGESFVRYVLAPHPGNWNSAGTVRKAMALNTPIQQIYETYHRGPLGLKGSGLSVSEDNVIATVFKIAEDLDGYILRCYESAGLETTTKIDLPLIGRSFTAHFTPCQIKTFHIPFDTDKPIRPVNILEMA